MPAIMQWYTKKPLHGVVHGCPIGRECKAKIRAPALTVTSCASQVIPVNYSQPVNLNVENNYTVAPPLTSDTFIIDLSLMLRDRESINLVTAFSRVQGADCVGTLNLTACTLDAAIGEYDTVVTSNEVISISGRPTIIALANNTKVITVWNKDVGWYNSTLAGIVAKGYEYLETLDTEYKINGTWSNTVYGGLTLPLFTDYGGSSGTCQSYFDPRDEIVESLNKLMFYAGAQAASGFEPSLGDWSAAEIESNMDPGLPIHTDTWGYIRGSHNVFHTNFHWFIGAAIAEMVCISLVLPTYWGWWRLGRAVSFSPLEIAKVRFPKILIWGLFSP